MNETELLDALDQRMRSATARLDVAIGDEPDELPDAVVGNRRRPAVPVLAAAAVLVAALVGALVVLTGNGGDGEESTVAGQPDDAAVMPDEPTRLALMYRGDLGFELHAALDGPTSPSVEPRADQHLSAQAPVDVADPWAASVLVVSDPAPTEPALWLKGQVLDIAGVEAVVQPVSPDTTVAWLGDDAIHRISSTRLSRDEVIDAASAAIRDRYTAGSPLPGFTVLHQGTWEDFYRGLEMPVFSSDLDAVAYHHPDGLDFAISSETGNQTAFQLPLVSAEVLDRITVRGQDALVTTYGAGSPLRMVSWREPDGTIIRLTTAADIQELLEIIEPALQPMTPSTFASMVAATDVPEDQPLLRSVIAHDLGISSDSFPDDADPDLLAGTAQTIDGITYRSGVGYDDAGHLCLETLVIDGQGGSGTGAPLPDLESLILEGGGIEGSTDGQEWRSRGLVAGVVPPTLEEFEVLDNNTGAVLDLLDVQLTPIEDTSWQLLSAVVDHDGNSNGYAGLEVRITTTDGLIRYRL